jgi:hypothetical protein
MAAHSTSSNRQRLRGRRSTRAPGDRFSDAVQDPARPPRPPRQLRDDHATSYVASLRFDVKAALALVLVGADDRQPLQQWRSAGSGLSISDDRSTSARTPPHGQAARGGLRRWRTTRARRTSTWTRSKLGGNSSVPFKRSALVEMQMNQSGAVFLEDSLKGARKLAGFSIARS